MHNKRLETASSIKARRRGHKRRTKITKSIIGGYKPKLGSDLKLDFKLSQELESIVPEFKEEFFPSRKRKGSQQFMRDPSSNNNKSFYLSPQIYLTKKKINKSLINCSMEHSTIKDRSMLPDRESSVLSIHNGPQIDEFGPGNVS